MDDRIEVTLQGITMTTEPITIGAIINIESNKTLLSKGQYRQLGNSGSFSSVVALDLIDMVSCYNVLLPRVKNDKMLKVEDFLSLEPKDLVETLDCFRKVFFPKYLEVVSLLKEIMPIDELDENNE